MPVATAPASPRCTCTTRTPSHSCLRSRKDMCKAACCQSPVCARAITFGPLADLRGRRLSLTTDGAARRCKSDLRSKLVALDQILGHLSRRAGLDSKNRSRDPGRGRDPGGVVGLQQPSEAAAAGDSARLHLPDADSPCRAGRTGRPRMTSADGRGGAYDDGTRRSEILQTAASLIASSGLRTSLQEVADAAGILPESLYHHFESKEAILVELVRRYYADLERIGEIAQERLDKPD